MSHSKKNFKVGNYAVGCKDTVSCTPVVLVCMQEGGESIRSRGRG